MPSKTVDIASLRRRRRRCRRCRRLLHRGASERVRHSTPSIQRDPSMSSVSLFASLDGPGGWTHLALAFVHHYQPSPQALPGLSTLRISGHVAQALNPTAVRSTHHCAFVNRQSPLTPLAQSGERASADPLSRCLPTPLAPLGPPEP